MKKTYFTLSIISLCCFFGIAETKSYLLTETQKQATSGKNLQFEKGKLWGESYRIYKSEGIWKCQHTPTDITSNLTVQLEDSNVLILEKSVSFSGKRIFSLYKKNSQFNIIEFVYSDTLRKNTLTVTQGTFQLK